MYWKWKLTIGSMSLPSMPPWCHVKKTQKNHISIKKKNTHFIHRILPLSIHHLYVNDLLSLLTGLLSKLSKFERASIYVYSALNIAGQVI